MNINGKLILDTRKEKKISQVELAEGICTQGTISNIEKRNNCNNLEILSKICVRLGVPLERILVNMDEAKLSSQLEEIESLCIQEKYDKSKELLKELDITKMDTRFLGKAYYLNGVVILMADSDPKKSLFYFYEAINNCSEGGYINTFATCFIALVYEKLGENEQASIYYEKAFKHLNECKKRINLKLVIVCCMVSSFYLKIGKEEKARQSAVLGIRICQIHQSTFKLDELLLLETKSSTVNQQVVDLVPAKVLAEINGNIQLLREIENIKKEKQSFE